MPTQYLRLWQFFLALMLLIKPNQAQTPNAVFCVDEAFYYNTEIHINTFETDFDTCSEQELAAIGQELTDAYYLTVQTDPRLGSIIEMNIEICESLSEEAAGGRRLFFAQDYLTSWARGQRYVYNWYGSG